MGLQSFVSRICLVAVFFITGISNLSNLPQARGRFEADLKTYAERSGAEHSESLRLMQQNAFMLVALWNSLAVVCSIATVLKVKWSSWVLVAMLLVEVVVAWDAPGGVITVLKALSMLGGLLVMMSSVKRPKRRAGK